MHFDRSNKKIEFGTAATFVTFVLAFYGAGTAGTQVANVIVRNFKK